METLKHTFLWLNDEQWKSFLMDENGIQLSSKKHQDSAEMMANLEKKSIISLTKTKYISFNSIEKLSHIENGDVLTIQSEGKKVNLTFSDAQTAQEIAQEIAQTRQFSVTQGSQNAIKAIIPSLIILGVVITFTFIIKGMADDIAIGKSVDTSGRRALFKWIMAWLAETLGATGTLIVGSSLALACLYWMYNSYKNPANELVYS